MSDVTVIIPAYNAELFLAEAIQSALNQTLAPLEVIVVDDGSVDRTAEIARSFGSPIRCVSQANEGLSRARNRGIREARGGFIALLDADDSWKPDKLSCQVNLLRQHPGALACFTCTEYVDAGGQLLRRSRTPAFEDLLEALILYSCVIGPPSAAMIRRSAFDLVGYFDPRFSQCADWYMWLCLVEAGSVIYSDQALVRYRVHGTNMSKSISLLERDTFAVLSQFFDSHPRHRLQCLKDRAFSNHWMLLSGSYLHAWEVSNSLRCLFQGLIACPANVVKPALLPVRWATRLINGARSISI